MANGTHHPPSATPGLPACHPLGPTPRRRADRRKAPPLDHAQGDRTLSTRPRTNRLNALIALGVTVVATACGTGAAHASTSGVTKTVSYLGYNFQVPEDWSVVDLASNPTTCVRFDRHAVYLGTPGTTQDCPSHPSGRTEALLIESRGDAGTAAATTDDPLAGQLEATAPRITVTAPYDGDRALVQGVLLKAGLAPVAGAARHPQAVASARADVSATSLGAADTGYTGYGFDTCTAPSSNTMSAWMNSSPYRAVGIYIGGRLACPQTNLTAAWVQQQAAAGWRFMPAYGGVQASSITDPVRQGTASADDAINRAAALGFGPGSTLYDDMENYPPGYSGAVLSYLSAWTAELHARGYRSGVYSSASSGIQDLANNVNNYTMPDAIWNARWNGVPDTNDPVVPSSYWANHQRIHQYRGEVTENYGGVSMQIDVNYLDVSSAPGVRSSLMRLDTVVAGNVWDNQRNTDGTWTGASMIDGNGTVSQTATAALADGTFHVLTLAGGKVYDNQRSRDGSWSGAGLVDGSGSVTALAATGLADGTMHVQTVTGGNVYENQRNPDGSWTGAALLDGNGHVTGLAAEALTDGTLHLQTLVSGNVYENQRNTDGTWTGANQLDGNGHVTAMAGEALTDGTLHLQTLVSGNVYENQRNTNGTWTGANQLDGNGNITAISGTGLADGTLHLQTLLWGNVYENQRNTNGTWTGANQLDGNGNITAISAGALTG
ncbi:glycoside hydrolase domain-containing protein [Kitasatospora sp. NPDC048296]|uniref:glycoside hydrolase domain-containing protein n=1 Tax=Kitasatospora sp. NPDC048296 TaxID=3364048 RepID=UPI0037233232